MKIVSITLMSLLIMTSATIISQVSAASSSQAASAPIKMTAYNGNPFSFTKSSNPAVASLWKLISINPQGHAVLQSQHYTDLKNDLKLAPEHRGQEAFTFQAKELGPVTLLFNYVPMTTTAFNGFNPTTFTNGQPVLGAPTFTVDVSIVNPPRTG